MKTKILLAVALWCALHLLSAFCNGAQYFIDFGRADDSGNGLTTGTAWKRHPFMQGWSGSYSHTAGDRFIFKGGVTWPRVCFQWNITAGGNSSTNDYYTVDQAWYAGGSFVKPIFDFEHNQIGEWTAGAGVIVHNASFTTFEYLDFANHRSPLGPSGWGAVTIKISGSSQNVTLQNCTIRDWSIAALGGGLTDEGSGGGIANIDATGAGGTNLRILSCDIHQQGVASKSGLSLRLAGEIGSNTLHHVCNVFVGGGVIHDNHIYNITDATDEALHENALYTTGVSTIYNNVMHDLASPVMPIYCEPSRSSTSGNTLVYNNVVWSVGFNPPLTVEPDAGDPTLVGVKAYNNIFEHGSGACVRVVDRAQPIGLLELRNNIYITSGSPTDFPVGTINTLIESNNLTWSAATATAAGATSGNNYRITVAGSANISAGMNLSDTFTKDILLITRTDPWDIGAYEFSTGETGTGSGVLMAPAFPGIRRKL